MHMHPSSQLPPILRFECKQALGHATDTLTPEAMGQRLATRQRVQHQAGGHLVAVIEQEGKPLKLPCYERFCTTAPRLLGPSGNLIAEWRTDSVSPQAQ